MFFENNKIIKVINRTAAGTTDVTSSAVDMLGHQEAVFILLTGGITTGAITSVKVQQSSDDGATDDYTDLEQTAVNVADDDDNELIGVSVYRPLKRYLKLLVDRSTQDAELGGATCILAGANRKPVTQPAGTNVESHWWPAEGTA